MKGSLKLLLLLIVLFSCGSDSSEVANAVDEANFLLTGRDCAGARSVLDAVGYQATNANYIKAYASTYACEANYSTTSFFANDLGNLSATAGGFFGSLAGFSTSNLMTSATDEDFVKLQEAINTLLYAGNVSSSSSANRISVFGAKEAGGINVQALYMVLVNFGRWLSYYGNANDSGVKGAGDNVENNNCLFTYNTGGPNFILVNDALDDGAGTSGSCNSTNTPYSGANDISTGTPATDKARLCQGVVLFNNFVDLVINLTFTSDNTGNLNDLATSFNSLCEDVTQFSDNLCGIRDQEGCEALAIEDLEVFSAWLFERNFK